MPLRTLGVRRRGARNDETVGGNPRSHVATYRRGHSFLALRKPLNPRDFIVVDEGANDCRWGGAALSFLIGASALLYRPVGNGQRFTCPNTVIRW